MSENTTSSGDGWEWYTDDCPHCGQQFEPDSKTYHRVYEDGESEHGEYKEVSCYTCGIPLQRQYPEADVSPQDDPLVAPRDWVIRAQVLYHHTSLKHREAQVQALKEQGQTHTEIAETLDIAKSTVGEYSRRITERLSTAEQTLKEIESEVLVDEILETQLDELVIAPTPTFVCEMCASRLEPGEEALVAAEWVGGGWKLFASYCSDCGEGEDELTHRVAGSTLNLLDFVEKKRSAGTSCVIAEGDLETRLNEELGARSRVETGDALVFSNPQVRQFHPAS